MMSHTKTRSIPNENMALYMSKKSSRDGGSCFARAVPTSHNNAGVRKKLATNIQRTVFSSLDAFGDMVAVLVSW